LALDTSEDQVFVSIDGGPRRQYKESFFLPAGLHIALIERPGFDPVRREVNVVAGTTTSVKVSLDPTPEHRTSYERKANAFRTWGWVGVISGVAIAGAGAGYLLWNSGQKSEALDEWDAWVAQRDSKQGVCDTAGSGSAEECNRQVALREEAYNERKKRDVYGWIGVGVGSAAAITGFVLLMTGDDPNRYRRERPELARPRVTPGLWRADGATGIGAVGRF
jgi:hypothetical protein